ncbi:MAG TPA: lactonase family protein [Mycobacteriales bacterium]|nr:lactonase family protein [Mycobacteriales bacterium]
MSQTQRIYVGSYTPDTGGNGTGISLLERNTETGELRLIDSVAELSGASFLAAHPSGRFLYSVSEAEPGAVAAFAVGDDGRLQPLGEQETGGSGPCHLSVDPSGSYLLTANYGSGSICVHPIAEEGSLGRRTDLVQHAGSGPDPDRQAGPHAHNIRLDPAGRHFLAADLGTDELRAYRLDTETGSLESHFVVRSEAGAGPRHLVTRGGRWVHVADELASTVTTYAFTAATGLLDRLASVPALVGEPADGVRNYPSEIGISADERFIYVANRGQDCITVLAVEGETLRPVQDVPSGGEWPRNFVVVGSDLYVANQNSGNVAAFRIDETTGIPQATGGLDIPSPACILPL